jgi:hypothetical protein
MMNVLAPSACCHDNGLAQGRVLPARVTNATLGRVAAGLNIEGGYPGIDAGPNCRWINVVSVLDRPLVDNLPFDQLKQKVLENKYDLLEAGVDMLDEKRLLQILISILSFYISKYKSIIVHIHQAPEDAKGLQSILQQAVNEMATDCKIQWRTDNPFYIRQPLTQPQASTPQTAAVAVVAAAAECVLSLSQCAGFLSCQPPGTLLIPSRFVPFDVKSNTVYMSKSYEVANGFLADVVQIAQAKEHHEFAAKCLIKFKSQNVKKALSDLQGTIDPADFLDSFRVPTALLQVSDLWNPTQLTANQPISIK